jgi:hypothetical protein
MADATTTSVTSHQLGYVMEFEQKVIAALTGNGTQTSTDIAALLDELEAAVITAEDTAKLEHERSLDPSATPDPVAARQVMEDAAFRVGRLKTLLPRLQRLYQVALAEEQMDAACEQAEPLIAERDLLAAEFVTTYADCANAIYDLFERMADNSAALNRLRQSLPVHVALDLRDVELVARKLTQFDRDHPSIVRTCQLPNTDGTFLWPPRRTPDPVMFQPVPYNPRYSKDWGVAMEAEQRQREAEAEANAKRHEDEARQKQIESGSKVWW